MELNIITDKDKVENRRKKLRENRVNKTLEYKYVASRWLLNERVKKQQLLGENLENDILNEIVTYYKNGFENENVTIFKNFIFENDIYEVDILIVVSNSIIILELKDWSNAKEIIINDFFCCMNYEYKKYTNDSFLKNNKTKVELLKEILPTDTNIYNIIYINNQTLSTNNKYVTNNKDKIFFTLEKGGRSKIKDVCNNYQVNKNILMDLYQKTYIS